MCSMKVILKQDVDKLGLSGEVVEVKNGFGRNFLLPRGLAVEATRGNIKAHEEVKRQTSHKLEKLVNDATALAERLGKMELVVPAKVGEGNRIFGTVTTQQIADMLAQRGLDIDRRKVLLAEEIRSLGVFTASVRLHGHITGEVKIRVVPESESI